MHLQIIMIYLRIKDTLKKILPENFFARLILANNSKNKGKHCFVLQILTPSKNFIYKREQLLKYCKSHGIDTTIFKNLKFRFYLGKVITKDISSITNEEKIEISLKYAKQTRIDKLNGTFAFICCTKQFCSHTAYLRHWNTFHSWKK